MQKEDKGHSGLQARYKKSYETKDQGGSGKSIFDWKKVEGDVTFFKTKEGTMRINIVPYEIRSKNHPLVKSGDAEIGSLDYVMDIWIHRYVGVSQSDVICLKKAIGKPCPICEAMENFKGKGKSKEAEELKPKRMVYYNVIDIKNPDKGIQVLSTSHFLFEKELIEAQRAESEENGLVDFASVEDGCAIKVRCEGDSFGGHEFLRFKNFQFIEREDPLKSSIVEDAISFDECLIIPTYDEVKALFYGEGDEDEEGEEATSRGKGRSRDDEEEGGQPAHGKGRSRDDEDDEEDDRPAPRGNADRPVNRGREDKPASHARDEEEDDKPVAPRGKDQARDDDAPVRPSTKAPAKPREEDEGESRPSSKKPEAAKKPDAKGACKDCPHGHTFGKDCDDTPDCDKCQCWEDCVKAQK